MTYRKRSTPATCSEETDCYYLYIFEGREGPDPNEMQKQAIDLNGKTILVTGSPGFIGANLVLKLLATLKSGTVVSLDNMNDYYDVSLKEWRLAQIEKAAQD